MGKRVTEVALALMLALAVNCPLADRAEAAAAFQRGDTLSQTPSSASAVQTLGPEAPLSAALAAPSPAASLTPSPRPTPAPTPTPTPTPLPVYEDTLSAQAAVEEPYMAAPEEVRVHLTILNSGQDPIGDVRICRENGEVVEELGPLAAGDGQLSFSEDITPSQEQLEAGQILYLVRYTLGKDKPGQTEKERLVRASIRQMPARPGAEFTRSMPVTNCQEGEEATIAYRVKNTGNVALTNLVVSDALCGEVGRMEELELGAQHTFFSRFTVEETSPSHPTLRYSHRATEETFEKELAEASIYLANAQLSIVLDADQSTVAPGEVVTLTCKVTNNGTVSYEGLRLSDQGLGELAVMDGALRPGKEVVFTKTVALKSTTTFLFVLEGRSEGGTPLEMASNPRTVAVASAQEEEAALTLTAHADKTRLSSAGTVTFTVTVHNPGALDLRRVSLGERERGAFWTLEVVAPGDTVKEQSYWVDQEETFVFTAELTDAKGGHLTVLSNPVQVEFAQDGVPGGPAENSEGMETIGSAPSYQLNQQSTTFLRMMVGVLAALAVLITCVCAASVSHRRRQRRLRDRHIRRLRRSYRRELKEDQDQRTKPGPLVRQDTIRRAKVGPSQEELRRKPGSAPPSKRGEKPGKGGN